MLDTGITKGTLCHSEVQSLVRDRPEKWITAEHYGLYNCHGMTEVGRT